MLNEHGTLFRNAFCVLKIGFLRKALKEQFKNFIYSFVETEDVDLPVTKTPRELLAEAGYDLYECKTEADVQSFQKYYAPGEELCTFNGGRLNRCHVFFAVKKNVDQIKRKDFKHPKRQDDYGTSVISIQFTRGSSNTVSIKNRYNHTVDNPDATFSNNLDNIILGLTDSFENTYGFNLSHNRSGFEIPGYVRVDKFYKYNYELDNIYYCTDNLIIDNFELVRDFQQMERYILFDYFIIDLKEKTIKPYKDKIINGKNIKPGDKLIGIASSGVHSNGFSLVRKLYTDLNEKFNGEEVWKTLITPTKIYVKPILSLIEKFDIKGMSHITGGGFIENVPRMFNGSELTAEINKDSYPLPAIFEDMINKGVNRDHMYNTFNMGIGFVLCVDEKDVNAVIKELHELGEKAYEIGVVTAGGEGVCLK